LVGGPGNDTFIGSPGTNLIRINNLSQLDTVIAATRGAYSQEDDTTEFAFCSVEILIAIAADQQRSPSQCMNGDHICVALFATFYFIVTIRTSCIDQLPSHELGTEARWDSPSQKFGNAECLPRQVCSARWCIVSCHRNYAKIAEGARMVPYFGLDYRNQIRIMQ